MLSDWVKRMLGRPQSGAPQHPSQVIPDASAQRVIHPRSFAATNQVPVRSHYRKHWGEPLAVTRLQDGRSFALPDDFQVLTFRFGSDRKVYATCCMSQQGDEQPLELHWITSSSLEREFDVIMLLHAAAEYHLNGARLGLHHSVNFGQPWQPGSLCTRGFVSLPYHTGPSLEHLEGGDIRFLWLIPVTESEVAFARQHSVDELEERFERCDLHYTNPRRPSVV